MSSSSVGNCYESEGLTPWRLSDHYSIYPESSCVMLDGDDGLSAEPTQGSRKRGVSLRGASIGGVARM